MRIRIQNFRPMRIRIQFQIHFRSYLGIWWPRIVYNFTDEKKFTLFWSTNCKFFFLIVYSIKKNCNIFISWPPQRTSKLSTRKTSCNQKRIYSTSNQCISSHCFFFIDHLCPPGYWSWIQPPKINANQADPDPHNWFFPIRKIKNLEMWGTVTCKVFLVVPQCCACCSLPVGSAGLSPNQYKIGLYFRTITIGKKRGIFPFTRTRCRTVHVFSSIIE